MTFVAATASGAEAADDLEALCRTLPAGTVAWVRHRELVVAWASQSPWVAAHDDGDVIVVVDGRLHDRPPFEGAAAQWVLQRYREHGERTAEGLMGEFVLIVLDRSTRSLLVARDPVGVRPWYVAAYARQVLGASDIATLTKLPRVDTNVNEHRAIEYLAGWPDSRGETLYQGVRTVPPGSTHLCRGGLSRTTRHHQWRIGHDVDSTWDEAVERCRSLLDEAVRCRLGDGSATSELSGGLDSSAVVGTIVGLGEPQVLVGRLLFEGDRADERVFSDAVIDYWGIDAVSAAPWLPTEADADVMLRAFRRPPPDPNFTMFADLNRELVRRGRRLVLTGAGGDGAFLAASEPSLLRSAIALRRLPAFAGLARHGVRHPRHLWYRILKPTLREVGPVRNVSPRAWITPAAAALAQLPELYHRRPERVCGIPAIDERVGGLLAGAVASALDDVSLFDDWLGIRHSHPFYDPRLIEATYGLDPWWAERGGHVRALEVAAFSDRLPTLVATRRSKAEFSEVAWPLLLDEPTLHRVATGPLRDREWLDASGFTGLLRNAHNAHAPAALPLSRCVALDRWLRTL